MKKIMLSLVLIVMMPAFALAGAIPDTGQVAYYDDLGNPLKTAPVICADEKGCIRTFTNPNDAKDISAFFDKDGKQYSYYGFRRCFKATGEEYSCSALECRLKDGSVTTCPTECYTKAPSAGGVKLPACPPVQSESIPHQNGKGTDDCYGQDARYLINPRSYTKVDASGVNLVKDNTTGLMWLVKSSSAGSPNYTETKYSWATAGASGGTDFVGGINLIKLGGYNDWRLPTISELAYIADCSKSGPAIDIADKTGYFLNMKAGGYWSATSGTGSETLGTEAFYLDFTDGSVKRAAKTESNYVIAVRNP